MSLIHLFSWQLVFITILVNLYLGRYEIFSIFPAVSALRDNIWYAIFNLSILCPIAFFQSLLIIVPDTNTDVAVFHQPLIDSLVENQGFKWPQIEHAFYGSIPLAFHLITSGLFVFTKDVNASHIVNFSMFWMFITLIFLLARKSHLKSILICVLFFTNNYFIRTPTDGMQDLFRSILTVTTILFLFYFLQNGEKFFLVFAGLTAGLAVSTKMSEFVVVLYILVLLALNYRGHRKYLKFGSILKFLFTPFIFVGSFFYLRNLLLTKNPVYPFIFGHPGLSNQWIQDYKIELSTPLNIVDKSLNNNFLSPSSLIDFVGAFNRYFLGSLFQNGSAILVVTAFIISKKYRPIISINLLMYLVWFYFMLNHVRWALPAYLLTVSLSVLIALDWLGLAIRAFQKSLRTFGRTKIAISSLLVVFFFSSIFKSEVINVIFQIDSQFSKYHNYVSALYHGKQVEIFNKEITDYQIIKYARSSEIDEIYLSSVNSINEFSRLYTGSKMRVFRTLNVETLPKDYFYIFIRNGENSRISIGNSGSENRNLKLLLQTEAGDSLWCVMYDFRATKC